MGATIAEDIIVGVEDMNLEKLREVVVRLEQEYRCLMSEMDRLKKENWRLKESLVRAGKFPV